VAILDRFRSLTESEWTTPAWASPFYRVRQGYRPGPIAERQTFARLRKLVTEAEDEADDEWMAAFDKAVGEINPLTRKRDDYWAQARELKALDMSPEAAAKKLTAVQDKPAKKPAAPPPGGGGGGGGGGSGDDEEDDEKPEPKPPTKTSGGVPAQDDEDEDEDA
jgi:hypothetical protein